MVNGGFYPLSNSNYQTKVSKNTEHKKNHAAYEEISFFACLLSIYTFTSVHPDFRISIFHVWY
jgi:hypothetical protein